MLCDAGQSPARRPPTPATLRRLSPSRTSPSAARTTLARSPAAAAAASPTAASRSRSSASPSASSTPPTSFVRNQTCKSRGRLRCGSSRRSSRTCSSPSMMTPTGPSLGSTCGVTSAYASRTRMKLTDDKATLRAFGIRDGDEHLSIDYNSHKSFSKNHKAASRRRSMTSLDDFIFRPRTLLDDLNEEEGEKFTDMRHSSTSVLEEGLCVYQHNEQCIEESCKKGGFFRGWFSYSRLKSNRRTHAEDTAPSSCEKKNIPPKFGKWLSSK